MASHLRRRWDAKLQGMSRRDRRGCDYDVYLADPLAGWDLSIPADVAADIADAEAGVRALSDAGTTHVSLEGLARFLLQAESVGILQDRRPRGGGPSPRPSRGCDHARGRRKRPRHGRRDRQHRSDGGRSRARHQRRPLRARRPAFGSPNPDGQLLHPRTRRRRPRVEQNWIGGSSFNPCSAAFVPPPHEYLPNLLADLLDYVNGDEHSPSSKLRSPTHSSKLSTPLPTGMAARAER